MAIQDVRGRFASGGKWEPFVNEAIDGYDTVEWLAKQDWCNGKVGMYGGSYSGSVQLFTAVMKPPHLVTIIPNITPAMPFGNMPYEGGILTMGADIRWINIVENAETPQDLNRIMQEGFTRDWHKLLKDLPVIDLDRKILGEENNYWRKWVKHNTDDSYWETVSYLEKLQDIEIPVFFQTGWYDPGNRGAKVAYEFLKKSNKENIKMIIGPWVHTDQSPRRLYGQDMGPEADINIMDIYTRWFDFWLKDANNGIMDEPMVQVFNMGPNRWLKADTYPLPETQFTSFFLNSESGANSSLGDGALVTNLNKLKGETDSYIYNPEDPSHCFFDYLKKRAQNQYAEMIEKRKDVLVYETQAFVEPFTIVGPLSARLFASSSARDTDWCVMVYGLTAKGEPFPIGQTWGVIRARYRKSVKDPELIKPGEVYEYIIDLSHTGYTFSDGERLRMEISSAMYPEYSRNLNTGRQNELESEYIKADQKIYHSKEYPSCLILPVIRRTGDGN